MTDSKEMRREETLHLLKAHGIESGFQLTGINLTTKEWLAGSSFYATFGQQETYTRAEVYAWLGY